MTAREVSSQLEVAVDAQTAFRAFTAEMDLWWVRGPINFYDAARAVAKVCEPGVGGRILEVYESGDPLEVARITAWEPGVLVAWDSSVDDVRTEVRFTPTSSGTLVRVTAAIPDGGADRGGTAYVRVVPPWFGAWCARRADAPRWLADAFGLTPTNPIPDSDSGRAWIEFHVGNCSLLVFGLDSAPGGAPAASTHVPWLFVDDLDAHFARAVARGADVVEGIHSHGYRAYVARDPDGYTWTIAQARPGMK